MPNFSGSFSTPMSIISSPKAPAAARGWEGVLLLQDYLEFLSKYCPCVA